MTYISHNGISESIEVNVCQKGLGLGQGGMIVSAVVGEYGVTRKSFRSD